MNLLHLEDAVDDNPQVNHNSLLFFTTDSYSFDCLKMTTLSIFIFTGPKLAEFA